MKTNEHTFQWIRASDTLPTSDDADKFGKVLVRCLDDDSVGAMDWEAVTELPIVLHLWARIPPSP